MKNKGSLLLPLLFLFIIFNGFFIIAKTLLLKWGIDNSVLIVANFVFFTISLVTYFIQLKALQNTNPNVFFRSVMAGIIIKMFVCIIAVLAYRFVMKENFSTASVFAGMLVYLVYLTVEAGLVMKLNKKKNA